jgi:anti-sigma factor RsiW
MKQIVPDANCLTPDQIVRYLQDETSPVETRAVDRHLEQCPLCSDALEGAMQLPTAQLAETFSGIKAKISDKYVIETVEKPIMRVVHRPAKRYWLMGAAAASVAVLAVASFWFFQSKTTESKAVATVENKVENTVPMPILLDSTASSPTFAAVDVEKDSKILEKSDVLSKSAPPPISAPKTATNTGKSTEISSNSIDSAPPAEYSMVQKVPTLNSEKGNNDEKSENSLQGLAKAKESTTELSTPSVNADNQGSFDISNNPQLREVENNKNGDIVAARSAPTQKNYPVGATQNASIPTENRSVLDSYAMAKKSKALQKTLPVQNALVSGIHFFNNKKYDLAIADFNRLLTQEKTGQNYETALWYLANTYLKKGEKATAKKLLNRIVAEKSKFSEEASALLKE